MYTFLYIWFLMGLGTITICHYVESPNTGFLESYKDSKLEIKKNPLFLLFLILMMILWPIFLVAIGMYYHGINNESNKA